MNTGLIQTLLESVQALQASVKAIEAKLDNPSSVVALTPTEAPESGLQAVEEAVVDNATKKHPLGDYKITKKDIDSLVLAWDGDDQDDGILIRLSAVMEGGHYSVRSHTGCCWQHAKPYLDTVAMHFKPWHATKEDVPPSDLKDGEWFAMLMEDGSIDISCYPTEYWWNMDNSSIIGYRPLSFVNPILDEEK